jgi:hypothetical protein
VWVQASAGRQRAYVKVHNAYLSFDQDNPFLDFYLHAAEQLLRVHQGPMVPQLIGPKLLTALHNLVACPVQESAGMLSPLVAADLMAGGGRALDLYRKRSTVLPAAVNLCASLTEDDLRGIDLPRCIDLLLDHGFSGGG